jgi:hypothetical protein
MIDYIEVTGKGLPEVIKLVKERSYNFGKHFAPHEDTPFLRRCQDVWRHGTRDHFQALDSSLAFATVTTERSPVQTAATRKSGHLRRT